jgi:glycosyltransferase involved in cell wall biosynthesis
MKKMPMHKGEYDIAIAYWGDHTMFYMIDKVKARKKISWLHFDYDEPPREDALYQPYFEKCDKVVTVSREIERSLGDRFPGIRGKTETIENFINESEIKSKAKEPCSYREGFDGKVLLSVGRICAQKGFDLAIPAVAKVHREQKNIRYYIIGEGEEEYKDMLLEKISNLGADDFIKILPATDNPFKYMARCDVYLQPSRHEGKPITVEEAKILERPLCLTNYKSAREQVENVKKFTICSISEEGICNGIKEILEKT